MGFCAMGRNLEVSYREVDIGFRGSRAMCACLEGSFLSLCPSSILSRQGKRGLWKMWSPTSVGTLSSFLVLELFFCTSVNR